MPNWIATRITVTGKKEKVDELVNTIRSESETTDASGNVKTETNVFDFNKVIPMPEELSIESGSTGEWGKRYLVLKSQDENTWTKDDRKFVKDFEKKDKADFDRCVELGQKYLDNIEKYGYQDWYSWSCARWGTKWNSVCAQFDRITDTCAEYLFDTAWSFCAPVIEKLSEMFPDVEIEFAYSDEDCGCNCGSGKLKGGEYVEEYYPDNESKEAYELYIELHPGSEDDLIYNEETGTYEWRDFDDEDDDV